MRRSSQIVRAFRRKAPVAFHLIAASDYPDWPAGQFHFKSSKSLHFQDDLVKNRLFISDWRAHTIQSCAGTGPARHASLEKP